MKLNISLASLKDVLFIITLCYNGYLNHINNATLNKQNLAVIELCDKLSLKITALEERSIIKSNQ